MNRRKILTDFYNEIANKISDMIMDYTPFFLINLRLKIRHLIYSFYQKHHLNIHYVSNTYTKTRQYNFLFGLFHSYDEEKYYRRHHSEYLGACQDILVKYMNIQYAILGNLGPRGYPILILDLQI